MTHSRNNSICLLLCVSAGQFATADHSLVKSIEVVSPFTAPSDATYWMQARAAAIPRAGTSSIVLITLQQTDRVGTHMYHGLEATWSEDLGKTWSKIKPIPEVDRITHPNGLLEAPVDITPKFHELTGTVLATGATFWQDPRIHKDIPDGPSATAYAVCDPKTRKWGNWKKLKMPDEPKFYFARAGCTQRVDLPNGDVLLPIYFRSQGSRVFYVTVVRCSFDGETLRYVEHGNALTVDPEITKRRTGLHEPSLTQFGERFYLTLRAEDRGYVSVSNDGLHFTEPKAWTFDDGGDLGSYNTQQHWVTHSDGLFLSYTRRGANNDDVMRHRAPLFVAHVDPERLVIERATEKVLLPNYGAAFGNFGVRNVTPLETWVVDCLSGAKKGEPSLYIAKIHWEKPNALVVGSTP